MASSMNTAYLRPGEFRICPRCSSRQKGRQRKCDQCGASLDGAHIAARAYVPTPGPHPLRSNQGLRAVLVLAVVGAILIGFVLRNTFSGAALDEAVASNEVRAQARAEVAGPDPSVYERNAAITPSGGVPEGWYQLSTQSMPPPPVAASLDTSTTVVESGAYTVDPAAVGGMVGITPGSSGLGRRVRPGTTFTNADLATIRTASVAPPLAPTAPALDDRALVDQQRRRDAENDLRAAQSKVEVLRTEADVLRRQSAGLTDPAAQQEQQRRLKSLLDDLEDAEKDRARAEKKLREG
jgi:hypothetical protein